MGPLDQQQLSRIDQSLTSLRGTSAMTLPEVEGWVARFKREIQGLRDARLPVPVPASKGGTGQSGYAVGDLLYADTASSLARLADIATGNALLSGGVGAAPAWGKVGLATHVSGQLPVTNGGTGAADAAGARSNLSAAASGANSDITSLSGLTTPLSVAQGGANATTAAGARSSLGAAASGANSDITSLSGLTTPLSVAQGGTGAADAASARGSLSAAASGANSDITSLSGLSTPLSVAQGGTGASDATTARTNLAAAGTGDANTFTQTQTIHGTGAGTTNQVQLFRFQRSSTGTPGTNFGILWDFELESSDTTVAPRNAARFDVRWLDATDATRRTRGSFFVAGAAGYVEAWRAQVSAAGAMQLGFFGVAATDRPSALTQTYSTTSRTHSALTSSALTDSTTGSADTTVQNVGAAYSQATLNNNFADIVAQLNALRTDLANAKNFLNVIADDLQLLGLES